MKMNELYENEGNNENLFVVTRDILAREFRPKVPWLHKGDRVRVVSVDPEGYAKLTTEDGGHIGIHVLMRDLQKI